MVDLRQFVDPRLLKGLCLEALRRVGARASLGDVLDELGPLARYLSLEDLLAAAREVETEAEGFATEQLAAAEAELERGRWLEAARRALRGLGQFEPTALGILNSAAVRAPLRGAALAAVDALRKGCLVDAGACEPRSAPADDGEFICVPHGATLQEAERAVIDATVARHGGNRKAAADVLGVSRRTLYNKHPSPDACEGVSDAVPGCLRVRRKATPVPCPTDGCPRQDVRRWHNRCVEHKNSPAAPRPLPPAEGADEQR